MVELKKMITSFKKDGYKPVYFLMGEEPYFIDFLSDHFINNVISEEEKSFNQVILYGKDVSVNDIMSQARQYPFMGDKMLVVVKEAQELVKTIDQFAAYFKSVQPSTILVFCYKYKTLDKRKELYKTLSKSEFAEIFESNKLKDYQVEGWIKTLISDEKLEIEPKAVAMLVEFLGNDLSKISNEIDKLKIVLKNDKLITADLVEENIGISKEYNNFELINAVAYKNEAKAFSIAKYFALNTKSNPFVVTTSLLYNFFSKLLQYHGMIYKNAGANPADIAKQLGINQYGLKDYQAASKIYPMKKVSQTIAVIREIDLKGKGVNGSLTHDDLLKELLIKVLR
ncbi:DNA polymerase III, delta subunit [Paenimyroides ummariense]|uniref:DNA polymerase III subunit delta n=1 Tax=Paenimyroides ummariense TaxID=913024 RepID=A0A1I4XT49_9FLAO|nr:DNA polymerase III subunit delta [Paenimyroides ummariense]SFN28603.1 DNA polymerase III, delta subunit [Paenimyroides ummariense]